LLHLVNNLTVSIRAFHIEKSWHVAGGEAGASNFFSTFPADVQRHWNPSIGTTWYRVVLGGAVGVLGQAH